MTLRSMAKQVFEKVLRLNRGNPGRMAGRSLILAYHNVVPDQFRGRGDRSLHLPLSAFRRQLDLLEAHCEIRPLADLLIGEATGTRPRVAITFDDAYRGAIEFAVPELARRGLPSTVFVAPGLLGHRSFWWDELANTSEGLPNEVREAALGIDAGRHERIRAGRLGTDDVTNELPECYGCATEVQIRALDQLGSVTLGPHSWSHPNLTRVDAPELATELARPLEWLRGASARTIPVLAYPYGLGSPTVQQAVQRAGYTAALLVEGGWLASGTRDPWAIPRYNIPAALSADGLMLRLSGLFPS